MTRSDLPCADAFRHIEEVIEFDVVITESARDGSPPGKILLHKRTNDLLLEALLKIDDIVGDAELLRNCARVVYIIERTAPASGRIGLQVWQPPLIPELHGESGDLSSLTAHHGSDHRRVHT